MLTWKHTHNSAISVLNYTINLYPMRQAMNGRIKKVDLVPRIHKIKNGIHNKSWYTDWNNQERWAAQQALNNVLDVLEEYWE